MIALTALAMVACVSATPTEDREAAVYVEVARWFLSDVASETPVFLDHREEGEIDLAVQAAVVERLGEFQSVRFIDSVSEAVDETEPGAPVRDGGVFLRLGSLEGDGVVSLVVSRYVSADEVETYRFTLRVVGDRWDIQGVPTPVQSER